MSKPNWVTVQESINKIQDIIKVRDSIPSKYESSAPLAKEMTDEALQAVSELNSMIADIVVNGTTEEDIPF